MQFSDTSGSSETLGIRVAVGRFGRALNRLEASVSKDAKELVGILRILVVDEESLAAQEAVVFIGEVSGDLCHKSIMRVGRDPSGGDSPCGKFHEEEDAVRLQSSGSILQP